MRPSVLEHDVARGRLQEPRGERLDLRPQTLRRHRHSAADGHSPAAAEGAAAERRDPRVGRFDAHALERHAEAIGHDLRDRRRVALSLRRKARRASHAAVGLDAHARGLDPGHVVHAATAKDLGAHAGVFRVAGDPDADGAPLRTRLALRVA